MYACNGILFNHESPRRGETFVTRKITRGISSLFHGKIKCLYLGNLDSKRDWGHAKDYVRMQWMMLQQDEPEDFVIATGQQFSVRDFINWSFDEIGVKVAFEGEGDSEIGKIIENSGKSDNLKIGDVVIRIDPKYYRPTEVDSLLGDPSKAKQKLGWVPEFSARDLCREMIAEDLKNLKNS